MHMAPYRVLIVDDQREVRRVLRAGIETLSADILVTDVPSGEEAILVISQQPIDLLIADIRLPGISGFELKERAKSRNPDLKLILITGLTDVKVRQEVADAGADAFFYKPIGMSDFLEVVQECLGLVEHRHVLPKKITEPQDVLESPATSVGLAERLSGLRQELAAMCVLLLDDQGHVMAQAGDLPGSTEEEEALISASLAAFGVATKVSFLLGEKSPKNLLSFLGKDRDIFLTQVMPSVGLLLVTPNVTWNGQLAGKLLFSLRSALRDLRSILTDMGVPLEGPELEEAALAQVEPEAAGEQAAPGLEAIFGRAGRKKLKTEDVDAFWESATAESSSDVLRSDAISYDQARKLGLAPEE